MGSRFCSWTDFIDIVFQLWQIGHNEIDQNEHQNGIDAERD